MSIFRVNGRDKVAVQIDLKTWVQADLKTWVKKNFI